MKNAVFAYLDILGVRQYVNEHDESVVHMLENFNDIVKQKHLDQLIFGKIDDKEVRTLVEQRLLTSVNSLSPFSDSVFVVSYDPNMFVQQISSLLIDVFRYTTPTYRNGYLVVQSSVGVRIEESDYWNVERPLSTNPILFRGGIDFGSVNAAYGVTVHGQSISNLPLFSGRPVNRSVELERTKQKGPRLFCSSEFVAKLTDDIKSRYVVETSSSDIHEILWPIFCALPNDVQSIKDDFTNLFNRAKHLLYRHIDDAAEVRTHYVELGRLIIRSARHRIIADESEDRNGAELFVRNLVSGLNCRTIDPNSLRNLCMELLS